MTIPMTSFGESDSHNAFFIRNVPISADAPTNMQILSYDSGTESFIWADVTDIIGTPLVYKGLWNAVTNTPTLADGVGTAGSTYVVSVAGTRNLGSGAQDFEVNDLVIYNGTTWQKVDHTDAVVSVAGKTGAVTLVKADVGLSNVDNTSDASKPVSTAQAAADAAILVSAESYSDGKVLDSIADSDTTHAPSRNSVFDALALKQNKIALGTGNFANDVTKTTTPTASISGWTATIPAEAGDVLEISMMCQVVSNGSSNGVGFNFLINGVDYSFGKIVTIVGSPQWLSGTEHYTVQSGDISSGNVTVDGRWGLDNTNSTTIKGRNNVNNHFSVKNLRH
jgi:hypothetical protein